MLIHAIAPGGCRNVIRVRIEGWPWQTIPLPNQRIEPTSVLRLAFTESDAVPTELSRYSPRWVTSAQLLQPSPKACPNQDKREDGIGCGCTFQSDTHSACRIRAWIRFSLIGTASVLQRVSMATDQIACNRTVETDGVWGWLLRSWWFI